VSNPTVHNEEEKGIIIRGCTSYYFSLLHVVNPAIWIFCDIWLKINNLEGKLRKNRLIWMIWICLQNE
jgi:hypothetical protein